MAKSRKMWGERIVNNLMDKVADRLSAAEIIKANSQAEAAETERLRTQVAQYQQEIDEIRKKAAEITGKLNDFEKTISDFTTKLSEKETLTNDENDTEKSSEAIDEVLKDLENYLNEHFEKNEKYTHDIGVQVYRNVQASMKKELEESNSNMLDKIHDENDDMIESILDENYESMQRALEGIVDGQKDTDKQIEKLREDIKKYRGTTTLSILTFVLLLANLAILILRILGII